MGRYTDKAGYTATKISPTTFSISLLSGHQHIPEGVEQELYGYDDTYQTAFIGTRSGSTLTFVRNIDGYEWPAFSSTPSGITFVSTVSGETFDRKLHGVYGCALGGQSECVGYNEGKDATNIEYTRPYITDFVSGNNYRSLAKEPLRHPDTDTTDGKTAVSTTFALHYGQCLYEEGYKQIEFICGGVGGTGFGSGYWQQGGVGYEYLKDKIVAFLDYSDRNYLGEIVMSIGQADMLLGASQSQFETYMYNFAANIRSDVQTASANNVNISTVPINWIGMSALWIAFNEYGPGIEAALANAPTVHPYGGYTQISHFSTASGGAFPRSLHLSAATHRRLGSLELINGRREALENNYGSPSNITGLLGVTLSSVVSTASGTLSTPITGTVAETLDVITSTASGMVFEPITGTVAETLDAIVSTATGDVPEPITGTVGVLLEDVTPTISGGVNINPYPGDVLFVRGVGQTTDSGNLTHWVSQEGSYELINEGPTYLTFSLDSGAAGSDAGKDSYMGIDNYSNYNALFNDDKYTFIIEFKSSGSGTGLVNYSNNNRIDQNGAIRVQSTGTVLNAGSLTTGTKTWIAWTVDRTLGTPEARCYRDDSQVDINTSLAAKVNDSTGSLAGIFNGFGCAYGNIYNIYLKSGEAYTLSQIQTIINAEFL